MIKFIFLFLVFIFISCGDLEMDAINCQTDKNCPEKSVCEKNKCIFTKNLTDCQTDNDCTNQMICDKEFGICRDNTCSDDNDCQKGQYCKDNTCHKYCNNDDDCENNQICDPNNKCIKSPCIDFPCEDNFHCEIKNFTPICKCDEGYTGENCDTCIDGYHKEGDNCIINEVCTNTSCTQLHKTVCNDTTGIIQCLCDEGYTGENCDTCLDGYHKEGDNCIINEVCNDTSCTQPHKTVCDDTTGIIQCLCDEGYTGENCDTCIDGYHKEGDNCIINEVCTNTSCTQLHKTVCNDTTGIIQCLCDEGYTGENCDTCLEGYHKEGDNCIINEVCTNTSCTQLHRTICDDSTGVIQCFCEDEYHLENNECVENTCDNDNDCSFVEGKPVCDNGKCWQKPFIVMWRADENGEIEIKADSLYNQNFEGYNYQVDCDYDYQNGIFVPTATDINDTYICIYDTINSEHYVAIRGKFPKLGFAASNARILEIIQWGTIKWESMKKMFYDATELTMSATDSPDLSNVQDMSEMFYNAKVFNGDISNWDVSNVWDMSRMFQGAETFNADISNWNVGNVRNMLAMFKDAKNFNANISNWDVSKVSYMQYMFSGAENFNTDISSWDVANVADMSYMFSGALVFNQDISSWNVGNVTNMRGMFSYTNDFNQPLNTWNVSNVRDMVRMFYMAQNFNQDLDNWNVENVTNMTSMFAYAHNFNGDVSTWDTKNVRSMGSMFSRVDFFNQDISNWDVSNVTNMSQMFSSAFYFNQDISNWNVSNVTNMSSMFSLATRFNQDISNWDVSNVQKMKNMFLSAQAFDRNISSWNVCNVTDVSNYDEFSANSNSNWQEYEKPDFNNPNCNNND